MTPAGLRALAAEREARRVARAVSFLHRHLGPRVAHLDSGALTAYTRDRLTEFGRQGLDDEQDQLCALLPAVMWGRGWAGDAMPQAMLPLAGHWEQPQNPRQRLSQALTALDIWHAAMQHDLADRHRAASVLYALYADPRARARIGRDPRDWCARFAPAIWALIPQAARDAHCADAALRARRWLPAPQDEILFACLGLVLGVGFADDPLYPQFAAAIGNGRDTGPDGDIWTTPPDPGAKSAPVAGDLTDRARLALGDALADYWTQISKEDER